jgi:hypothetical protein
MNASSASQLGWYARRVARMSPAEAAWRARDRVLQVAWSRRQVTHVRSSIVGALTSGKPRIEGRPGRRLSRFADAGITLLRTTGENEIWCRRTWLLLVEGDRPAG